MAQEVWRHSGVWALAGWQVGSTVQACAGLGGQWGPCVAVAVVPTSLGRVVRGSAGGSRRATQAPEQQFGGPLGCCQSYFAGQAAISLRWQILQVLWEALGRELEGGEGEGSWGIIGEVHSRYNICQFFISLLEKGHVIFEVALCLHQSNTITLLYLSYDFSFLLLKIYVESMFLWKRVSLLLLTIHKHPQHLAVMKYAFMWLLGKVALHCMYVFISASNFRNLPYRHRVVVLKMLHISKTDTFMTQSYYDSYSIFT